MEATRLGCFFFFFFWHLPNGQSWQEGEERFPPTQGWGGGGINLKPVRFQNYFSPKMFLDMKKSLSQGNLIAWNLKIMLSNSYQQDYLSYYYNSKRF